MSRKIQFVCLFLLLGLLLTAVQSGFAQADPPLTFGNNYFVTGDYAVGGVSLNGTAVNGFATGTISIGGDTNPGVKGTNSVPQGAQIVAALLYWETLEIVGGSTGQNGFFRPVFPGGPQTGYAIKGTILNNPNGPVFWGNTGCASTSPTSKQLVTYRADVRGYLQQDASGNVLAGNVSAPATYEVSMASQSSGTPLTMGATLVLIYRVISPKFPLSSIVIYNGTYSPTNTLLTTTQTVQGFYQATANPVSKLTYIVGNGQKNLRESVSLSLTTPSSTTTPIQLPSLYGSQPPFPGWYENGLWDNPTWFLGPTSATTNPPNPINNPNPVPANAFSAKTVVNDAPQGCVAPAAIIFSTTVQNSDGDGLLDVWKVPLAPNSNTPGYCDAAVNEGNCKGPGDPAWVDLPGAKLGEKDLFVQLDYMCSSVSGADLCNTGNGNYSFDPRPSGAVDMMTSAFSAKGIHLHVNAVNPLGTTQPVHAIQEVTCTDNFITNPPLCGPGPLAAFPNQPGVVGWKAGFEFLKSQPTNYPDESTCESATNPPCVRRFQHGAKDSKHYAVFAHALGRANWGFLGGSLTSVMASGNTVTFTTAAPHGVVVDNNLGNGRVTVADAITNPDLNGTHLVTNVSPFAVLTITQTSMSAQGVATYTFTQVSGTAPIPGDLVTVQNTTNGNGAFNVGNATIASVVGPTFTVNGFPPSAVGITPLGETGSAQTARAPFTFSIQIGTSVSTSTFYTQATDPNLTVTSGQAGTGSGFSDLGGADTLVTLGSWPPANQTVSAKAGTFMHELGHTLGLTHGGFYYDNNPPDYRPTVEANCKTNYQSVMNYMFQVDLLGPSQVLDFSSQQLGPLNEKLLPGLITTTDVSAIKFTTTTWYDAVQQNGVGTKATHHCDTSPLFFSTDVTPTMYWYQGGTTVPGGPSITITPPWSATSLDINFDGKIDTSDFRGYNDWTQTFTAAGTLFTTGIDLRQLGATSNDVLVNPGTLSGSPGSLSGSPGSLSGSPGSLSGSPGTLSGSPGTLSGGPGSLSGAPGASGGGEIDFATANSFTRPPRNLTASEGVSPRTITLNWTAPTFGQIVKYKIYRSAAGGPFNLIATVSGAPPATTFPDNVTCNPGGYSYFVTAVVISDTTGVEQESVASNIVSTGQNGQPLTGCYAPTGFNLSAPTNAVHGSIVSVTFTVQDASNAKNAPVNTTDNPALVTFVVNGPLPGNCGTVGDTTIVANGVLTPQSGVSTFPASSGGNYTLNLDTDVLCAGQYTIELILDNQVALSSHQMATAPLRLSIDVNDTDSTPHVATLALTAGTVGQAYSNTLIEDGGTAPFKWTFTPSLPPGITQQAPFSPMLSGTTCVAGSYNFTAMVTDFKSNSGTQPLTLQINQANTTTGVMSSANPSMFQQMVTFTVTVAQAPPSTCTPTGTVTLSEGVNQIATLALNNSGMATFTTSVLSVGMHNITASYGGDSNFKSSSSALVQTVNPAQTTTTITSVLPSPAFVGQAITVAYTFTVVPPGAGTPIAPSGTITVAASDNSRCVVPAALGAGACVLMPAPTTAGKRTFTVTYSGDNNFVLSGANGNYTVYQLVFTVQPSNTGVGLTMTPAVQVAAQDGSNNTLQSFTGSITLAIGSGPGTLSGTTTQNAVSGVATFNNLSINKMANGYALVASLAGGVAPVTSNAFNIDGVLFAGSDHNTFNGILPDQLGRFTINGANQIGGSVLSVPYHINGMAQGAGKFLYAGDPFSNTLQTIDFNGSPVNSVFTGNVSSVAAGFPNSAFNEDMAFDAANNVLWHAHFSSEIEKLNPATGAVITAYAQPDVVGITFVGNTIWITHWSAKQVGTWDPATNIFTAKFSTPANAGGLAYDPVNAILWVGLQGVGLQSGFIVPYNPVTGLPLNAGFSQLNTGTDTVDGLEFVSQVP